MPDLAEYLAEVELALIRSSIIAEYQILQAWANTDDGYLRVRATLVNGDFLEAAEYVVLQGETPLTVDYRYQWMDSERRTLRRRWDNAPHHPELENFPHHIHQADEATVTPGHPLSFLEWLAVLEEAMAAR